MTSRTLGAVLTAASLIVVACNSDKGKQKQLPIPVAVARVTHRDVPYNITADGVVEPMQTAQVQAQVGGILTKVTFKEGDEVKAGQVLFQIDPQPYKAALDQAAGNLARDLAAWQDAKAEAARYTALVKKDYVTQEQVDQMIATEGSDAAMTKADSAAVEQARINLGWTTITAPITGRTGQLMVKQGNLLRAGMAQPLVLINQIQPILVHFAVPATSLPAIQLYATKIGGKLPVTVIPGMPPSATAVPTLSGPTPAYTTDPSDDPQGEAVGVGAGDANGGSPDASGAAPNGSGASTGSGHHGGRHGQAAGPGATTASAAGDPPGGARGTTADPAADPAPDGPPNTSGARPQGSAAGAAAARPRRPASLPGLPGVPAPAPTQGTLTLIDNQVDTTTGTVLLKGMFQNADNGLWPGEFVATTVRLFVEQNALVVPAQAVVMGQQGTYVYMVDASGTARQRPVVVERTAANTAIIASGLSEGEQVVTDGQSRLTPGAKVNIRGLVAPGTGGNPPAAASSSG